MNNSYCSRTPHKNFAKRFAKFVLRIFPDSLILKTLYKRKLGRKCDLKNPKSFNEKLQWIKLHDRKPLYTDLCDKLKAKELIAKEFGEQYVLKTYCSWDEAKDIDYNALPDRFVLKCNHDCGSVVVCRDKKTLDKKRTYIGLKNHLKYNYYSAFREWPYKNIKRRVFAEEYIESADKTAIIDYKFYCFSGVAKFLYVSKGLENHKTATISFFDLNGRLLSFKRKDFSPAKDIKMPNNFNEMIDLANRIAKYSDSKFVRVDLYTVQDKIYFSECTFFPCGGFTPFEPKSADDDIGKLLVL